MPAIRSLLVLLCCTSFCLADHQLQTLSNKTVKGRVVAITDQEVKMIDSDGKEVVTPLSQVIAIDLRPVGDLPADAKYSIIQLFESRLYCNKVEFKGNQLEIGLLSGQTVSLPLGHVISLLHEGQNKTMREQWEKMMTKVVKTDRVLVVKDGELDALEGSLGDVDPAGKTIQFQLEGGLIKPLLLEKMKGIIFYRPQAPAKAPVCIVHDTMGNKIGAASVALDKDNFIVTTPGGAKLTFAEKALAKFDYNQGKLLFLSDVQPSEVIEESGIGLAIGLKYRKDSNLDGDPIILGKTDFAKGLTLHAHTELEYNLDSKYKDFKALLGVDARAKTESKAIVIIECDGTKAFKETVDAQKPIPINLNVRNVNKLRIIVTSEEILHLHDQATLAEARISQ